MCTPEVTFEDDLAVIGTLPSLAPRLTATNIRALEIDSFDKLTMIQSEQSVDFGYSGKVEADIVYALKMNIPRVDWKNPGPHVTLADNLTDTQITNIQEEYKARKMVWDSQYYVNRSIISGLNLAVPRTYRREVAGAVGTRNCRFTDEPKVILQGLQNNYGQMAPAEKTKMEAEWSAAWNPSEPIELLFNRLEDFYVLSVAAKPAYTQEQMIDKALTGMQRTGLHPTVILEYQVFPTENKNWTEFKNHFAEAYMVHLQSGKSGGNPYHGAANA